MSNDGRSYPTPEQADPPSPDELAALVGMPPDAQWALVETVGPIDATSAHVEVRVRRKAWDSRVAFSLAPEMAKRGSGCMFRLVGQVLNTLPEDREWPAWTVPLSDSGMCLRLWLQQGWRPGAAVYAQITTPPDAEEGRAVWTIGPDWKDEDLRAAGDALRFLEGRALFPTLGRRRLEDSPSSPGRHLARQALDLLANDPDISTIREAAVRLGMPKYDERRPDLDGKAEVAAERRLNRYIQRFRTLSDQPA